MDYTELLKKLYTYKTCYKYLLYADHVLYNHLTDPALKPCLGRQSFIMVANAPEDNATVFTPKGMGNLISEFSKKREISLDDANLLIFKNAGQYLRSRSLNAIYESINGYYKDYDSTKKPNERKILNLHSFGWFKILYILRNIASHEGGIAPVWFPVFDGLNPYPSVIKWRNIEITEGQAENTVRYNDDELINLFDQIYMFFSENYEEWNID